MVISLPIPKTHRKLERHHERMRKISSRIAPQLTIRIWTKEELDINEAQQTYEMVLRDMAKYAESQKKKEIQDQKRKTLASDRLQSSSLASGRRRD